MRRFEVYIATQLQTSILVTEPIGMADYKTKLLRHKVYNSVMSEITLDIEFVKDGRTILVAAFEDKGIAATGEVKIKELNPATLNYETIFEGVMDFTEFRYDEIKCSIPFESSDKIKKLRARDKNNYNLQELKSTDDITVPFIDGMINVTFQSFEFFGDGILNQIFQGSISHNWTDSGSTIVDNASNDIVEIKNYIGNNFASNDFYYTAKNDCTVTVTGDMRMRYVGNLNVVGNDSYIELLVILNSVINGVPTEINKITFFKDADGTLIIDEDYKINLINTFNLSTGDTLSYGVTLVSDPSVSVGESVSSFLDYGDIEGLNIGIEISEGIIEDSEENTWYVYESFARLIQLMTSETDTSKLLESNLLGRLNSSPTTYGSDGEWSAINLLSAKTLKGGNLNLNLRDLFESINAIEPIGLWYNSSTEKFIIEKVDEFYQDSKILTIDRIAGLKISVDTSLLYTGVEVGYNNKTNSNIINGYLDFNKKVRYSLPIERKNNTYKISSPYSADSVGINYIKKQREEEDTNKSSEIDDVVFMAHVKTIPTDKLVVYKGSYLESVEGIPKPEQWWNYLISPQRNLLRQLKMIGGSIKDFVGKIKFVDTLVISDISSVEEEYAPMITEKTDITINSGYVDPLFEPIIYDFEARLTFDQRNTIRANPHGYIEFIDNDTTYEGFIIEVDLNNNENKASFKLIKKY